MQPVQLPQPQAAPYDFGDEAWVTAATREVAAPIAAPTGPSAPWRHDPWFGSGSGAEPEPREEWAADRARSLQAAYGLSPPPSNPITVNPAHLLYRREDRTASGEGFAGPTQTAGHSPYPPVAFSQSFGVSGTAGYAHGEYSGQRGDSSAPQPPPPDYGQARKRGSRPGK